MFENVGWLKHENLEKLGESECVFRPGPRGLPGFQEMRFSVFLQRFKSSRDVMNILELSIGRGKN